MSRITRDPNVKDGKPCIRDLGITVFTILKLLELGYSPERIMDWYPQLELADIEEAKKYSMEKKQRK
jgi:uncharacterized protein (DUF433 family)